VPAPPSLSPPVIVAGSVTVALAATTVVTGVLYLDRRSDYEAASTATERRSEYDSAHTLGVVNAVCLAGTLAGAALTGYLYFAGKPGHSTAHVLPAVSPSFAGVFARSEF
jgi:hypothetical protein